MHEAPVTTGVAVPAPPAPPLPTASGPRPNLRRLARIVAVLAATVVALAVPVYVETFWLQVGLFVFAGTVAAMGLTLLVGQAGQLSLGHPFFVAIGAYGYAVLAGTGTTGTRHQVGLGLPPLVAASGAVLLAGLAGLLFSPIAARLRGIYLGIASFGLVFVGLHVLNNVHSLTGGSNGRDVADFAVPGFRFGEDPDETLYVLGVPFGREEKLWYCGLAVTVAAYLCARNLIRSRPGRALRAIRDRELMAGIMGVPVTRYKAYAFGVSSMYAGAGGVLVALAFGRIGPDYFGFELAVAYLAMVVIGGLGSPAGAVAGALFVASLPDILGRYASALPGLSPEGSGGLIEPAVAAQFAFGAAVIVLLLFEPGGLAAVGRRLRRGAEALVRSSRH